jgi:hypothetical protein
MVVSRVRERLAVNTQRSHKFHMERFHLKKLNKVQDNEQYYFDILNSFTALDNLDAALETVRQNINISAKELLKGS